MIFRPTDSSEIDRVMDVLADGRATIGALGIDQWQGGYPFRSTIEEDVSSGKSHVVDYQGNVIATAMLDFEGDSSYDVIEGSWISKGDSSAPDYACIHRVAVSADSQGRGVARFILREACRMAAQRGSVSVRIDTHPGNTPMRTLLERSGFEYRGVIRIAHAGEGIPERVAYEKRL